MIERNKAKLALTVACRHGINLAGHRLLAEIQAPALLHGATDVDAEDDGDSVRLCLLGPSLPLLLFFRGILDLGGRLEDIGDIVALWQFLIFNMNFVLGITKLAAPDLLLTFFLDRASLVEDTFARVTELGVASRELASVLKAVEGYLEDVCVELHFNLLALSLGSCVSSLAEVFSDGAAVVLVTQVQVTIELVGVHLLSRQVPVNLVIGAGCLRRRYFRLLLFALGEEAGDRGEEALLNLLFSC